MYAETSPSSAGKISVSRTITVTRDRKSTRLNSSHSQISYAVFCLKKKKTNNRCSHSGRSSSCHSGANTVTSTLTLDHDPMCTHAADLSSVHTSRTLLLRSPPESQL